MVKSPIPIPGWSDDSFFSFVFPGECRSEKVVHGRLSCTKGFFFKQKAWIARILYGQDATRPGASALRFSLPLPVCMKGVGLYPKPLDILI